MEHKISKQTFDEERALYNIKHTEVTNCTFAGPADGESALKETRDILVKDCGFSLRYPLWHARGFTLENVTMDDKTRAAIWYSYDGVIRHTAMDGIKCLRECENICIEDSTAHSPEFGWRTRKLDIRRSEMESEYFLFECRDVSIDRLNMKGKYSFQYVENMTITDSYLDTKDAFWHGKNITVKDSVLKGEYLAWFSENLTLINCRIIGTQPLCYCSNLKLINCTMEGTDLAFEYSDVEAEIQGNILSVKNPKSGMITADSIGEVIWDDPVMEVNGKVVIRE
ncbi:MAG: DUF3737 family protein [Lachnospiraceae bacterium]|nr:DUF3737 family protein [Lachnospiraceae bacterium]